MKNLLRLTLIISVVLISLSTTAAAKVPEGWLKGGANFEKAMQLHRELNVPLVVYFYVDWCPYCNSLENEYFPAAPMREYLRDVVKIRINPELTPADESMARVFGIGGYPSFFVIGPGSFPVQLSPFRRDGRSLTPAEFAQRCRDVTTPKGSTNGARVTEAPKPAEPSSATKSPGLQMTVVEPVAPKFVNNAPLPTADAVLKNYAQVTNATGRMTSRVIKGRIDVPGLSFGGKFEFYATAGGKSLTVMNVDAIGIVKQGFDGVANWTASENTSKSGASLPENAVLAVADFYRNAKLSDLFPKTKLLGKVKEGDRDLYMIEAAPRTGAPEQLYFDTQTGLLVHRDFTRTSSRGPIQAEIYFSDWRNVDGFRLPCSMTQLIGNLTLVITIDEIKHNVAIDDSLFQRPAR